VGGSQRWPRRFGEDKNPLLLPVTEPRFLNHKDRYSKSITTVNVLLLRSFIHIVCLRNNYIFRAFFLGHRQVDRISYSRQLYNAILHCIVAGTCSCSYDTLCEYSSSATVHSQLCLICSTYLHDCMQHNGDGTLQSHDSSAVQANQYSPKSFCVLLFIIYFSLFILNELCLTIQECMLLESVNVDNQFCVTQRRDVT
jgi:hypothetical protein